MKRRNLLIFLGFLIAFPSLAYSQPIPPFDKLFERWGLGFITVISGSFSLKSLRIRYWRARGFDLRQRSPIYLTIRPDGYAEYHFPYSRYAFQRFDHCFTVIVDVERTPYRTDAAREFCAKPMSWMLKP